MCGNTRAPSIVGRLAVINATPLIGSKFGPLKVGVTVHIDEEVEVDSDKAQAYRELTDGREAPDSFYRTTIVSNPEGENIENVPVFLREDVVLFREEFNLVD